MADQLLTHSRQDSFKRCRKRHWFEYELGVRPIDDARALRMGDAGHAGLEWLHGHPADVDGAADAVRAKYDARPLPQTEELAAARDFECETIVALVAGYAWRWADFPLEIVETEKSFVLPLINPETRAPSRLFSLAGKIDGIVKLEDRRKAVREHKFLSDDISVESDFWRRMQLDHQITMYVYAARQLGFDVATVLYDIIRKPTIKPTQVPLLDADGLKIVLDATGARVITKQGKPRQTASTEDGFVLQTRPMTCAEWIDKLMADIYERPDFYYCRHEIPRLDQDIEEFTAELWDIQKTLRDAQTGNRWYRTVGRDNCSFCPYFGLDTSKFDPSRDSLPEGFQYVENRHPELEI